MIHSIDISEQKFTCFKCGNCCDNILREQNISGYAYNFQGDLVMNPKTSLAILYNEKYELEKNLRSYGLQARIYPAIVFFMKDYPYGFIYNYQLGVNKKNSCMFYDPSKRECEIYPIRPLVCRTYPLGCNALSGMNLLPEATCMGVEKMLSQVDPFIKVGDPVYYPDSQRQMSLVFPEEFYIHANTLNFNKWEIETIVNNLGSMFLAGVEVTPPRVSNYALLNFREFIGWAKHRITKKYEKLKVQRFSQELEYGKQSFTRSLVSNMLELVLK